MLYINIASPATNSLFFVGSVEVMKPNSTSCCVGFRYRSTQPTILTTWVRSETVEFFWRCL